MTFRAGSDEEVGHRQRAMVPLVSEEALDFDRPRHDLITDSARQHIVRVLGDPSPPAFSQVIDGFALR